MAETGSFRAIPRNVEEQVSSRHWLKDVYGIFRSFSVSTTRGDGLKFRLVGAVDACRCKVSDEISTFQYIRLYILVVFLIVEGEACEQWIEVCSVRELLNTVVAIQ